MKKKYINTYKLSYIKSKFNCINLFTKYINKKIYLLALLLIISISPSYSQWQEIKSINISTDNLSLDEFGHIYYSDNNTLYKCNEDGTKLKSYSNSFLGEINSYDVIDPLRLLLFFKDFNQIVFLDNKLSELRTPVSLDDLNLYEVVAVCASHRGGFWAYSSGNNKLVRYNNSLQLEQENYIITNKNINLDSVNLIETSYFLILSLPPDGIFIYDGLGSFIKKIPSKNVNFIQSEKQKLYFAENDKIQIYDFKTAKFESFELPITQINSFAIHKSKIFIADNKLIRVFSKE